MPPLLQTFSDSDSPQRRKSAKLGEIEILNLSGKSLASATVSRHSMKF